MARYIDAEKLINKAHNTAKKLKGTGKCDIAPYLELAICGSVKAMPTEDVAPVVHAHWEWDTEDKYKCSNCGTKTRVDEVMEKPIYEYCPYCNAKMEWNGRCD